jgi:hypothetical protein
LANEAEEERMAVIRIQQPQLVDRETYDKVNEQMDVDSTPPAGMLMHSAGEVDGVWQIVDVWESEQHAQRFDQERLAPAIAAVTGAAAPTGHPPTTVYELHNVVLPAGRA